MRGPMGQNDLLARSLSWLWAKLRTWIMPRLAVWLKEVATDVPLLGSILAWEDAKARRRAKQASKARQRLVTILSESVDAPRTKSASPQGQLTFRDLYSRVHPPDPEWLATEL